MPSYHQERIWFIEHFETNHVYPHQPVYHNGLLLLHITGKLNIQRLEDAFHQLIQANSILRSIISTVNQMPEVQVLDSYAPGITLLPTPQDGEHELLPTAIRFAQEPMPLSGVGLLKLGMFQHAEESFSLALCMHHAIADHPTLYHVADLLMKIYATGNQPNGSSLKYEDFAQWQRDLPEDNLESLMFFWNQKLVGGNLLALQQPIDFARAPIHVYQYGHEAFQLSQSHYQPLIQLAQQLEVTSEDIFRAVWVILLYRYSGQTNFTLGGTHNNRSGLGLVDCLGPISNLIVFPIELFAHQTVAEIIHYMAEQRKEIIPYADMPFDKLVQKLNPPKDMSRTALFDVLFSFSEKMDMPVVDGLKVSITDPVHGWGKYDLHLHVHETSEGGIGGGITYNQCLNKPSGIQNMIQHVLTLLEQVLTHIHLPISDIKYLPVEEEDKLLNQWNDTDAEYPKELLLHKRFEQIANAYPNKVALISRERKVTYEYLNKLSGSLAGEICNQRAIAPDTPIAVLLHRGVEIPIALLGVLKSGGMYIPIDPSYPKDRIEFMMQDSGAVMLVSTMEIVSSLSLNNTPPLIDISEIGEESNHMPTTITQSPDDAAYVIYTSGTTGTPKGCVVSHRNVIRLLINERNPFLFNEQDVWIMAHSFCFDFSVWEMYGALLYGGCLVLPDFEDVRDTSKFYEWIRDYKVTVLNQTPGAFYQFIEQERDQKEHELNHLRYICFGGDKLDFDYLRDWCTWYSPEQVRLVNMYGITETTVHVTYHFLTHEDLQSSIPKSIIGKPLPETTLYLLDDHLQLVTSGVKAELFVGGSGVSKKYLNRPELSAQRFIPNPYRPNELLYRSGDVGRWNEDGVVEFLGRKDDQVKVRGYRIELAEIENNLLAHPHIDQAVVVLGSDGPAEQFLIGYYSSSASLTPSMIRDHLRVNLPEYMVPSYLVPVTSFPLTANGKIDKKNLPEFRKRVKAEVNQGPISATEKLLIEFCSTLLNQSSISITDHFFQIGGHSLKAVQLVAWARKKFNVGLELQHVFMHPVLRELAGFMDRLPKQTEIQIPKAEEQPTYPLSHAQLRMFVLHQVDENAGVYNIPSRAQIQGKLQPELLQQAIQQVLNEHENFRTVFKVVDGEPRQCIEGIDLHQHTLHQANLIDHPDKNEALENIWNQVQSIRFNLVSGPLYHIQLVKFSENEYQLMCNLHHIISDGITMQLLIQWIFTKYELLEKGEITTLGKNTLQYKDFASWQHKILLNEENRSVHHTYWSQRLHGLLTRELLPTDGLRNQNVMNSGGNYHFDLKEVFPEIQQLMKTTGITRFVIMNAIIKIWVHKISGEHDITTGTAVSGRSLPELQQVSGLFVNTLALRDYIDSEKSFDDILLDVNDTILSAYQHQDYPFNLVLESLSVEPEPYRHPIFDIMINEPPGMEDEIKVAGLHITPVASNQDTAKFDLMFSILSNHETITVNMEYHRGLYTEQTIRSFAQGIQLLAQQLLQHPSQPIKEVSFTSTPYVPDYLFPPANPVLNKFSHWTNLLTEEEKGLVTLLKQSGIQPGQVILIHTNDIRELLRRTFSAWSLGAHIIPVVNTNTPPSLSFILAQEKPHFIWTETIEKQDSLSSQKVEEASTLFTIYDAYYQGIQPPMQISQKEIENYGEDLSHALNFQDGEFLFVNDSNLQTLLLFVIPLRLLGKSVQLVDSPDMIERVSTVNALGIGIDVWQACPTPKAQCIFVDGPWMPTPMPTSDQIWIQVICDGLQFQPTIQKLEKGNYSICNRSYTVVPLDNHFGWLPAYVKSTLYTLRMEKESVQYNPTSLRGYRNTAHQLLVEPIQNDWVTLHRTMVSTADLSMRMKEEFQAEDCLVSAHHSYQSGHVVVWLVTSSPVSQSIIAEKLKIILHKDHLLYCRVCIVPSLPGNPLEASKTIDISTNDYLQECNDKLKTILPTGSYRLVPSLPMLNTKLFSLESVQNTKGATQEIPVSVTRLPESKQPQAIPAYASGGELVPPPHAPRTMTEAFFQTTENYPTKGITIIDADEKPYLLTYAELRREALGVLGGLQSSGLQQGDKVLLQIREMRNYFPVLWGCILGGITPVTVAVPHTYASDNSVLNKLLNTYRLLETATIIHSSSLASAIQGWSSTLDTEIRLLETDRILRTEPSEEIYSPQPDDLLFMQLTSGSTGTPKCIQETHGGVVWHILASSLYCGYNENDVTLNWLPFDHVVPQLTFHMKDMYLGIQQTEIKTDIIIKDPLRWLDYLEAYKVTHTWSPNFGFKMVADQLQHHPQRTWNLQSIKFMMNAGEQVTLPVVTRFMELTKPFGIHDQAMQPAFGMAEVCTCMTYVNNFSNQSLNYVDKQSLNGKLSMKSGLDSGSVPFMELGPPVPGFEIRITDEQNQTVEEGVIGRFQIRSRSVTPGYLKNPDANAEAFVGDGWFNSGDLGFIFKGVLTLTGREKETIIIRGANFYCYEFEDEVSILSGVISTHVGSCSTQDPQTGSEGLALFFSPQEDNLISNRKLVKLIKETITRKFGVEPSYVVPIPAHEFPKTTSGKIQRKQLQDWLKQGKYQSILSEIQGDQMQEALAEHVFEKHWQHMELLRVRQKALTILFFAPQHLEDEVLLETFAHHELIIVRKSNTMCEIGPGQFTVNPFDKDSVKALRELFKTKQIFPTSVVHAWNYGNTWNKELNADNVIHHFYENIRNISWIAGLDWNNQRGKINMFILSSQLQQVTKQDKINFSLGLLPGFWKSVVRETQTHWITQIDVDDKQPTTALLQLKQELYHPSTVPEEIAYRNQQRFLSRLRKVPLSPLLNQNTNLEQNGFYVITGGLGGVAFALIENLQSVFHVDLLLLGRTSLTEDSDTSREKLRRLEQLQQGGRVHYRSLQITDAKALEEVVVEFEKLYAKPLHGVLHLAGTLRTHDRWDNMEQYFADQLNEQEFESVFEAKVRGTMALHQLSNNRKDLRYIHFSSVNSYFGAYANSPYAAASSFLEHFSSYQEQLQIRSQSQHWSMWESTGMSADSVMEPIVKALGFDVLLVKSAIAYWHISMRTLRGQVFIGLNPNNRNIQTYLLPETVLREKRTLYWLGDKKQMEPTLRSALKPLPYAVEMRNISLEGNNMTELSDDQIQMLFEEKHATVQPPTTPLEIKLHQMVSEILPGIRIGVQDNFFELGGNSIKIVQLFEQLNAQFPDVVTIGDLFDMPTIYQLAGALENRIDPALVVEQRTSKPRKIKI